jgi:hypothetical protein
MQNQLVDSNGYKYTKKSTKNSENTLWRCSVRNKRLTCHATVIQKGITLTRGKNPHTCERRDAAVANVILAKTCKERGVASPFTPATEIVESVSAF